jgi:hypothetical protein
MLTSSFTLLLAFFMAPYQHVHLGIHPDDHDDHDAGAIVHVHFYAEPVASNPSNGSNLEDSDRDHRSRPLDTFAIMLQAGFPPFVRPESQIFLFPPPDLLAGIVEVTEPCGHDPPCLDFSIPRAPPS